MINLLHKVRIHQHCPVALPWFRTMRPEPDINWIHQRVLQLDGRGRESIHARLGWCVAWPVLVLVRATGEVRRRHRAIRARFGVSALQQWRECVYYGVFFNHMPSAYYQFELWLPHRKTQVFHLMQDYEVGVVLRHINRDRDTEKLDDKQRFIRFARERGLPVPTLVATFREGVMERETERFPRQDLFVKNNNANGGLGAAKWTFEPQTGKWSNAGENFDEQELADSLCAQSRQFNLILQVCERLHPDLLPFSNGALATYRAMTIKHRGEAARMLHASLRIPVGDSVVDNVSMGGPSAKVRADGTIDHARVVPVEPAPFDHHPDTGAPITGARLPFHDEMRQLALDAHDAMPEFCTVAWDIAMTERGPVIIEANSWWGLELFQHTRHEALGDEALLQFVKKEWH